MTWTIPWLDVWGIGPWSTVIAAAAVGTLIVAAWRVGRRRRVGDGQPDTACHACGYDRRGLDHSANCPECRTDPSARPRAKWSTPAGRGLAAAAGLALVVASLAASVGLAGGLAHANRYVIAQRIGFAPPLPETLDDDQALLGWLDEVVQRGADPERVGWVLARLATTGPGGDRSFEPPIDEGLSAVALTLWRGGGSERGARALFDGFRLATDEWALAPTSRFAGWILLLTLETDAAALEIDQGSPRPGFPAGPNQPGPSAGDDPLGRPVLGGDRRAWAAEHIAAWQAGDGAWSSAAGEVLLRFIVADSYSDERIDEIIGRGARGAFVWHGAFGPAVPGEMVWATLRATHRLAPRLAIRLDGIRGDPSAFPGRRALDRDGPIGWIAEPFDLGTPVARVGLTAPDEPGVHTARFRLRLAVRGSPASTLSDDAPGWTLPRVRLEERSRTHEAAFEFEVRPPAGPTDVGGG